MSDEQSKQSPNVVEWKDDKGVTHWGAKDGLAHQAHQAGKDTPAAKPWRGATVVTPPSE